MKILSLGAGIIVGVVATLFYQSLVPDEFGSSYTDCLKRQELLALENADRDSFRMAPVVAERRCELNWTKAPPVLEDTSPDIYTCTAEWGFEDSIVKDDSTFTAWPFEYSTGAAPNSHGLKLECWSRKDRQPVRQIALEVTVDGDPWQQTPVDGKPPYYSVSPASGAGKFSIFLDLGRPLFDEMNIGFRLSGVRVVSNDDEYVRAN